MTTTAPEEGLRERKKAATRARLTEAAYELVRDHGLDSLTAEAIADRAGVSRRTFFNYFPTVESALQSAVSDFFAFLGSRLEETPAGEPIMNSLERMVAGPTEPELFYRISVMAAVSERSGSARRILQEFAHDWLDWFEDYLRGRLGPDVDDLYVLNLATAIVAAAESASRMWARRTGGVLTPESVALHHELLARSVAYLRTGFQLPSPPPTDAASRV